MFFGATDALQDAWGAAAGYHALIVKQGYHNLLVCYGFLQALYVQQDAVQVITRALDMPAWSPSSNSKLKHIRNIRNRLSGHPALADKAGPKSSAIIISIGPTSFEAAIYYEDRLVREVVVVDKFAEQNAAGLVEQLERIKVHMVQQENEYKDAVSQRLADALGNNFSYHFGKLATCHADRSNSYPIIPYLKFLREDIERLIALVTQLNLSGEAFEHHVGMFRGGLDILESIDSYEDDRRALEYNLVHDGMSVHADWLLRFVRDTDRRLVSRD